MKSWKRYVVLTVALTVFVLSQTLLTSRPTDNSSMETADYVQIRTGNHIIEELNIGKTSVGSQTYYLKSNQTDVSRGEHSNDDLKDSQAGEIQKQKTDKSNQIKTVDILSRKANDSKTIKTPDLPAKKAYNLKNKNNRPNPRAKPVKQKKTNTAFLENIRAKIEDAAKADRCKKQKFTNIGFQKVHRAGSIILETVFYHFGLRNNLTFALPKTEATALVEDESKNILPIKKGSRYDIFVSDSVYDATKFSRVLPANSLKIGIVRDPFDRMVSAAYYYRDVKKMPYLLAVPEENFIFNLIRDHSTYDKNEFSVTRNSMAKDFGFPQSMTKSMSKFISDYIHKLTVDFSVVLVLERLEESLILMKRYLNWEMRDILFIPVKTSEYNPVSLNAADLAKFKSLNHLDYALYENFSKILDLKLKMESPSFQKEVEHFKTVLKSVKDFCSGESGSEFLHIHSSPWTCPFILYRSDCLFFRMDPSVMSLPVLTRRHKKMHGIN